MNGGGDVRVGRSMGSTGDVIRGQGRLLQVFCCRTREKNCTTGQERTEEKEKICRQGTWFSGRQAWLGCLLDLEAAIKKRMGGWR